MVNIMDVRENTVSDLLAVPHAEFRKPHLRNKEGKRARERERASDMEHRV